VIFVEEFEVYWVFCCEKGRWMFGNQSFLYNFYRLLCKISTLNIIPQRNI
jgi:hypothetical protein